MNKTVTINISGIIFHIEEDAYEKLSKYLSTIRGYFSNAEGRDEIMADIEARIAELLKEKTNSVKQVVVMADVDHVVSIMGKPEDYAGDSEHASEDKNVEEPFVSSTGRRRRVFRDGDSKILGGVCSGVANYFDIDALWIRLALVVMFFGFGTGFILYIILWIIIPEARTTAEKLEMRGERIDINNISKTVKEETENFKTRAKDFGTQAKQTMSRQRDTTDKFVDLLRQVFGTIFNVLGRILGFIIFGIGVVFFIALIGSFFGLTKIDNASTNDVMSSFYNDPTQHFWLFLGVLFFIGIPAIMFMYKGVKMMFNFKYHNRWLNLSAGILWLVGLVTCMIIGINIGQEFSEDAKSKEAFTIKNAKMDTLILKLNTSDKQINEELNEVIKGKRNGRNFIHVNRKRWMIRETGQRKMWIGSPEIEIIQGEADSIEVNIIKSACGVDRKTAFERAKGITYRIAQQGSIFTLDSYFEIGTNDKWRDQEVLVQIKIPKNKVIYMDRSLEGFLNGIDNITDTYDSDMLGRRWKMTPKGLGCIDCEGLENLSDNDMELPPSPPTPPAPFDINTKDAKVKIDEHGINIKSKDANVKIDEKGINIETKEVKK